MQKKLIAIAVAAALAPAVAMADTSNVVLYGKLHMSYDRISTDNTTNDTSAQISQNSSRLGFKGSEDLGDGLKAIFQYETGISPDGPGGAFNSLRDAFLGLSGNFGTVTAGRQAWHNLYAHDANMFSDQIGAPSVWIDRGGRTDNSIKYATPNMNGFDASVTYVTTGVGNSVAESTATSDNAQSSYALKANYKNGPVFVSLTHLNAGGATSAAVDWKATSIAGNYDFGAGKVVAQYVRYKDDSNVSGVDYNVSTIGANYKVTGNSVIKAQYTRAGDGITSATSTDDGANMITLGYDYSLSKRTTAYVAYSRVSNDLNGKYKVTGSGQGAVTGGAVAVGDLSPTALSFGLVHDF